MPISELSAELVLDIVESYGQITKLNLSTNEISRVENLEHLTSLTSLDLFCNRLGSVPGSLEGLSHLTGLKDLDISDNAITSLQPLSAAPVSLLRLNVGNNSVEDVGEVSFLTSLTTLTELILAGNPMAAEEGYRAHALTVLPSLLALDHTPTVDRCRVGVNERSSGDGDDGAEPPDPQTAPRLTTSAAVIGHSRRPSFASNPVGSLDVALQPPGSTGPREALDLASAQPVSACFLGGEGNDDGADNGGGGQQSVSHDSGLERQGRRDYSEGVLPISTGSSASLSTSGETTGVVQRDRLPLMLGTPTGSELSTPVSSPSPAAAAEAAAVVSSEGGGRFGGDAMPTRAAVAASRTSDARVAAVDEPDGAAAVALITGDYETRLIRLPAGVEGGGAGPLHLAPSRVPAAWMPADTSDQGSPGLVEHGSGRGIATAGRGVVAFGARLPTVSLPSAPPVPESVTPPTLAFFQAEPGLAVRRSGAAVVKATGAAVSPVHTLPQKAPTNDLPRRFSNGADGDGPPEGEFTARGTLTLAGPGSSSDRARYSRAERAAAAVGGHQGLQGRTDTFQSVSAPVESAVGVVSETNLRGVSSDPGGDDYRSGGGGDGSGGGNDIEVVQEGRVSTSATSSRSQLPFIGGSGSGSGNRASSTTGRLPAAFDSGDVEGGSHGTLSGDRRHVTRSAAAATATAAAAATVATSATTAVCGQDLPDDRDAITGSCADFGDVLSRLRPPTTRMAPRDARRHRAHHQHPGYHQPGVDVVVGAAASVESGGGQDPSHRSGPERAEEPGAPRKTAPLTVGSIGVSSTERGREKRWRSEGEDYGNVTVNRGEWDALRRENDDLRRQATLAEKRCAALMEMQRLADEALSSSQPPLFSSFPGPNSAAATATKPRRRKSDGVSDGVLSLSSSSSSSSDSEERSQERSQERRGVREGESDRDEREGDESYSARSRVEQQAQVAKLLATWRAEVLKLLLQRGADAEVAAEESREAQRKVLEEREARILAETEAKSLAQRALAAEAEAELSNIKLSRAYEELRDDRAGRRTAEASSEGYSLEVRSLHEWVGGFVRRASEGLFEREALLARGVAKLEAFSERLNQASGRIQFLGTLLRHKEVQLRNSRAALAADRRVWLLERRDREIEALSKTAPLVRRARVTTSSAARSSQNRPVGGGGGEDDSRGGAGGGDGSQDSSPNRADGRLQVHYGGGVGGVGWNLVTEERSSAAVDPPLLEGLRPECEAVMRALFCRVDRLGVGAVRARRLLEILRSDCGVSEVMEAAVGKSRWKAALDSMETALCPPHHGVVTADTKVVNERSATDACAERDVTWGEFLLFFLPSVGRADEVYNAGLVAHTGPVRNYSGGSGRHGTSAFTPSRDGSGSDVGSGVLSRRLPLSSGGFGAVSDDAAAMLQMVVPPHWSAGGGGASWDGDPEAGRATAGAARASGREGASTPGRGLTALSVGQLRREMLRLSKERAFLMALVREDGRLGKRRVEAVHDQYRHELRELHNKMGDLERALEDASCRADTEHKRVAAVQEEASRLREEAGRAEQKWKSRLDAAGQAKSAALAEASRKALDAETSARERISRLEAEHSLALRENGKASVRQRALERELARIKSSVQVEAAIEKEALEERLREGESKIATVRRERNALLAALRDLQRRGRSAECDPLVSSLPAPPTGLGHSPGGGGSGGMKELRHSAGSGDGGGATIECHSRGGVDSRNSGKEELFSGQIPPSRGDSARAVDVNGIESSRQEPQSPDIVESRAPKELQIAAGAEDGGDRMEAILGAGRGRRRETSHGADEGSGRRGSDSDGGGGSGRATSLTARLEFLALQTKQLLANGTDTSCSSSDDDR